MGQKLSRCAFHCLSVLIAGVIVGSAEEASRIPEMPMPIKYENTAVHHWLNKPVAESRLLDDMESPANWSHHGFGEMAFTEERAKNGRQSLRLVSPTLSGKPSPNGRPFGSGSVRRSFAGEDWGDYNRLSFWVYPTLPGFRVISMSVVLYNEGSTKVPGPYGRTGRNYFLLKPDTWNHVVWEISHLARDKVTGVEFIYRLQGHEPEGVDTVCYEIDHLELQKVHADHYEGWNVAPGKIAFSHTGYSWGSSKSAIASGIAASVFKLVNAETGEAVLTKPIRKVKSHLGEFQVLDFSEVREPGEYFLRAGDVKTRPFRIDANIWRDTIWKTINFFYCERCGTEVPGIHGVCHRDWQCEHDGKRIVINGGWHDAGDLSQGVVNTSEATCAMLALAEMLRGDDPALAARLIEEAKWGLEWILKTRFGDGYRTSWATMDFWTDGIIGTADDMIARARNSPFDNFVAASAEALAGRVLQRSDPILASYCLKAAREDWQFAVERTRSSSLQLAAAGASASLELFKTTGDDTYKEKAVELAETILESQQKSFPDWRIPLTGFFYTSPKKDRILHYSHRSHEEAPIVALVELCTTFPNHTDWMKWYSAVVLYSEYLRTISKFTDPYGMLPNSIYRIDESNRPTFREQVLNGIQVGENHYLRLFPVWEAYRGNNGTMLSQTKALSAAAHLRRNVELADLAQKQLQWVVGRNPFVQSTMYGEGYDYAPQYTAMSGDMVGSLAVGIQTSGNRDAPYWPADNCYNFKEVWVHPSARWLSLMCDLAGPAEILGQAEPNTDKAVEFREIPTGESMAVTPDAGNGRFRIRLPEGRFRVAYNGQESMLTLLPGERFTLDLRQPFRFQLAQETTSDGQVIIKLEVQGEGRVLFAIRASNLDVAPEELEVDLQPGKPASLTLAGRMKAANEPWVAVVSPNGDLSRRKEIIGSIRESR